MTGNIPNLSAFYSKELTKKTSDLVKALSEELKKSINFFSSQYIIESSELDKKYELLLSDGYSHLNKINAYTEILGIKDDNQCNKLIYEDCNRNCFEVTKFINSIHELRGTETNVKFNRLVCYSKIVYNQPELTSKADLYIQNIIDNVHKETINFYNNYINEIMFSLIKISNILDKLNDY